MRTCIQAIVSASPELVAKLGQDYTVYAYDYSEYETPLVGQGMLSWVLASSSSTPSAPAHISRTVVTGRVCKNIMGLFTSSSQETLEVKLRLVPVPTCLQSEYMESMRKYRDLSKIMPMGFDPGAWTTFIQANPAIMQLASQSRGQSPAIGSGQSEGMGLEHVQRLLGGGSTSQYTGEQRPRSQGGIYQSTGEQRPHSQVGTYQTADASENLRPASPAASIQSVTAPPKRRGRPPRNASKTSVGGRDTQPKALLSRDSVDNTLPASDDRFEEGPAKKRAKVSKADWDGSVGLGKQTESLRVAASTAASVRIHQPTALRPSANNSGPLQCPPRAPTPIADPTVNMRRPPLPTARSGLRRESYSADTASYESPYSTSDAPPKPPESAMTSPENSGAGSLSNTPANIASSPPLYRGISTAPSSPNLPSLPRNVDSNFRNGSVNNFFEDDEFRSLDDEDLDLISQYSRRTELPVPGFELMASRQDASIVATIEPQSQPDSKATAHPGTAEKSASNSQVLGKATSSGTLAAPSTINNDVVQQDTPDEPHTWSNYQAQHATSDPAVLPQCPEKSEISNPRSRAGNGAGAKRKKAIQSKLELSVAAGEMPPFCENCGAIETPTWRKAWVKVHSGTPEHVKISEEEGGIVAWQSLMTDSDGNVCLYRIVKRTLLPIDEGFTEILLCNRKCMYLAAKEMSNRIAACGLWLHTRKCMRPKEIWEKTQRDPDEKRKRAPRAKKATTIPLSAQANEGPSSHGSNVQSDGSSPANDTKPDSTVEEVYPLPQMNRHRASSEQVKSSKSNSNDMDQASAAMALQRAIQSSPARLMGTEHAPIQVEALTPKPTRRVLFPSPRHTGDLLLETENSSKLGNKDFTTNSRAVDLPPRGDDSQSDKENCPPDDDETFDHLFEDTQGPISRPATPSPSRNSRSQLFKTPRKTTTPDRPLPTTGDFFSSTAKALLLPSTPKRTPTRSSVQILGEMSPFSVQWNQILSEGNHISPSAANTDFLPLPQLGNTPGGRVRQGFDFTQFDSGDFLSTDAPMPSSPPSWFGVYEDPVEQENSLWGDFEFPVSPGDQVHLVTKTGQTVIMEADGETCPGG